MFGSIEVENVIGMRLLVNVESVADAYAKQRELGAQGWRPGGVIPERVLEFPLAMADRFDWSLIGAREFMLTDKENGEKKHAVEYRGEVYKRRDLEAKKIGGKPLPPAVKYSRGAHDDDPKEIVEPAPGDSKGYVSLAIFRGNGPVIREFCKPTSEKPTGQRPPQQEPPKGGGPSGDPMEQDFDGHRGRHAQQQNDGMAERAERAIDAYLAQIPLPKSRQIRAMAAGRNMTPERLAVLIGGFCGKGNALDPRDVDKLLARIREAA